MGRLEYWAANSTYEYMLNKAREYLSEGKYNDALIIYLEVMHSGVDSDIYYEAACCYYNMGKYKQAASFFEKSLQLNDRRLSAFNYLAGCYYKLNDISNAILNYSRARALKPDDGTICLKLGNLYSSKNMFFESVYHYNKYIQYAENRRDENFREVSRSLSTERSNAERISYSASRAFSVNDYTAALSGYREAVNIYPINYNINFNFARVNHELKNYKEALKYFIRTIYLDDRDNKLYLYIAAEYSNMGDYTRAYCFTKRYLSTLISNVNQKEYLDTIKTLKSFEPYIKPDTLNNTEILFENNHYWEAYLEYENISMLKKDIPYEIVMKLQILDSIVKPEISLSKFYNKKGMELYNRGLFKDANKFFSRVMEISGADSEEYKQAKQKMTHV